MSLNDFNYDITIQFMNQINNHFIYQIYADSCFSYFKTKQFIQNFTYVFFIINEKLYVYSSIEIDTEVQSILKSTLSHKKKKTKLLQYNALYFVVKCTENLASLKKAQQKIADLNKIFPANMKLGLDFMYNLEGKVSVYNEDRLTSIILCLYTETQCVSSIEVELPFKTRVKINSKTNVLFQNQKYNKLLRAVTIMIAKLIFDIDTIESQAVNAISVYSLITHFRGTLINDTESNLLIEHCGYNMTLGNIQEFFDIHKDRLIQLPIHVALTQDNIEHAEIIFQQTLAVISQRIYI